MHHTPHTNLTPIAPAPAPAPTGRSTRKKLLFGVITFVVAVVTIVAFNFTNTEIQGVGNYRNYSPDAIIQGGAITEKELVQKFDQNASGVQAIFKHYGINRSDLTGQTSQIKHGVVYQDGRVVVDGKTVATAAWSVSRKPFNDRAGNRPRTVNVNGTTLYEGPNMSIFVRSVDAYVFFRDGQFYRAVISSCANPVVAKPVPQPIYKCNNLTATKINRTRFRFAPNATAQNGARIVSYSYDFGDGLKTTSANPTIERNYAKPGTYTATVTVNVQVDGRTVSVPGSNCKVTVRVEEPPKVPVYKCESLTSQKISRTQFRFRAAASVANGPQIVSYTYNFGNGRTATTTRTSVDHTYAAPGTYNATVTANIRVNGKTVPVSGSTCRVTIKVDAAPKPPVYRCDSLTAQKINRTQFRFNAKATAQNGAEIVSYTYNFGDGVKTTRPNATVDRTYQKPGTYTATVTVNVKVNGKTVPVTGANCKVTVKVEEPPKTPVYKCDNLTARAILSRDRTYTYTLVYTAESGAELIDATYNYGDGKSATFPASEATNIEHTYAAPGNYTTTVTLRFNVPVGGKMTERSSNCEVAITIPAPEMCPVPGKEHLPKNSPDCEEPPLETPPELPQTGPMAWIGGGLGIGAIVGAFYYWNASRRNLTEKMLRK